MAPSYAPEPERAEDVAIPDDPLNEDLDTIPTEPGEDTPLNSNRPRFVLYQVKKNPEPDIPIEPQFLDALRVTVAKFFDGKVEIVTDDGASQKAYPKTWVGVTIYQISGAARKELCMHVSRRLPRTSEESSSEFKRRLTKVEFLNGICLWMKSFSSRMPSRRS